MESIAAEKCDKKHCTPTKKKQSICNRTKSLLRNIAFMNKGNDERSVGDIEWCIYFSSSVPPICYKIDKCNCNVRTAFNCKYFNVPFRNVQFMATSELISSLHILPRLFSFLRLILFCWISNKVISSLILIQRGQFHSHRDICLLCTIFIYVYLEEFCY